MKKSSIILLLFVISLVTYSQSKISYDKKINKIKYADFQNSKKIFFSPDSVFYDFLELDTNNHFTLVKEGILPNEIAYKIYNQTYKNIPLEDSKMVLHLKNNVIIRVLGDYLPVKDLNLQVCDTLIAIQAYKNFYQTNNKADYYIEKTIIADSASNYSPKVCYKILSNDTTIPNQKILYIDALTGRIIRQKETKIYANSELHTRYYGIKYTHTEYEDCEYILKDINKNIQVYTANGGDIASIITDSDTVWTENEHSNNYILDAFWSIGKVYDYFNSTFGWKSYNGENTIIRIVVDAQFEDNACWKLASNFEQGPPNNNFSYFPGESYMEIGKSGNIFFPLTKIDVIAHEFAHGLDLCTSDLYDFKSGEGCALGEGTSDIWASVIKSKYILNENPWKIGEGLQKDTSKECLRDISNPKNSQSLRQLCDTYMSEDFFNNEEEHYWGGIFSHWFYLLSEGGSGQNDHGHCYNVDGIGIDSAAKLLFISQSGGYLNVVDIYPNARKYIILIYTFIFCII